MVYVYSHFDFLHMYYYYPFYANEEQKVKDAKTLPSGAYKLTVNEVIVGYFKSYYSACRFAISKLNKDNFEFEVTEL